MENCITAVGYAFQIVLCYVIPDTHITSFYILLSTVTKHCKIQLYTEIFGSRHLRTKFHIQTVNDGLLEDFEAQI
jgi:hypothetical protein